MNMTPSCPTTIRQLTALLAPPYDQDEARDIVLLLLSEAFHLSLTDVACGALASLSPSDHKRLMEMMERLRQHEPVQYVLGKTTFCHRVFHVDKNVLIPRPETQSLCGLIVDEWDRPYCGLQPPEPIKVLDVGTGSGCIAVTLALSLPCSRVTGWDVSGNALLVARDNAHRLGAKVDWKLCDALSLPEENVARQWDVIVSNPPYIAESERKDMRRNVLGYEPGLALFVPDADPLRFYRAIASYAARSLRSQGKIYFEVNPRFASKVAQLLLSLGFVQVETIDDNFGRQRMVRGTLPCAR